ncbi:MAG: transcription elongation factor GreA [bacterium]
MNTNVQYLSPEKIKELKAELEELVIKKRKEVVESLEFAKSLGDLSENAEYQEARELQRNVEERVAEIETILKNVVVVSGHTKGLVGMGSVVELNNEKTKDSKKYQVVGSEESNVSLGKISDVSPLGSALIGKKVGDIVTVNTPKGAVQYKITEIK